MEKYSPHSLLRIIAFGAVYISAVGSFGFMLYGGRHGWQILLLVLFAGWVLSPFAALVMADRLSNKWTNPARVTLYLLMLVIATGSLVFYSGTISIPDTRPAFIFLVLPLVSWLLIAIIPIGVFLSRRK